MSQVYDENNQLVPVTIIEAGPTNTSVKKFRQGRYQAIQIALIQEVKLQTNRISVKKVKRRKPM